MLKKTFIALAVPLMFGVIMITQSCQKNNETNISSYNSDESHNMGQNCMNCHNTNGKGAGTFMAAGTVYDSLMTTTRKNGIVRLYSGPNQTGTLRASIEVDGHGNFYTTENIDFAGGVYPTVTGSSGDLHFMSETISMGECNSCHGVTTNKIYVK
jgi:cytochrome c553